MTTTSVLPDVGVELREGYAEVGDVTLHYVEAGEVARRRHQDLDKGGQSKTPIKNGGRHE